MLEGYISLLVIVNGDIHCNLSSTHVTKEPDRHGSELTLPTLILLLHDLPT